MNSSQQAGELTIRCFDFKAKRTTARAPTACPASTTAMAMLIGAKPRIDSDFGSKTAIKNTTAPTNQQDPTAADFSKVAQKFDSTAPTDKNFIIDRTLGATLRAEHYAAFRRPPPTYDKSNRSSNAPTGPTTGKFNMDRTLGATLRAEHYAAFRRPPPTYDRIFRLSTSTSTVKTLGATLRKEHYQAFRRPPQTRDKH